MKKYGLFIGVNKYNRVKPHLKGAEADARLLAGIFAERLGFTTSVLTDEQLGYGDSVGSQDRIFEQLEEFREKLFADGGGVLVVYFAGHGITNEKGEQFLLVPKAPEYALSKPKAGTMGVFSEETLCAATDNWPGVKRAFIFDACRTSENRRPMAEGEVGGRLGMAVPRREGEEMPEDLVILRACPSDQIACELKNYGEKEDKKDHGLFSAALLEVICQKADEESPLVLDGELSQKLGREMHRLAKEYIKDAPPEMKGQALAQHPEFHGGRLRLIDKGDYRQLKIKRLLGKFEQQFAAGNFSDPPGESCRDILAKLADCEYDRAVRSSLFARILSAEEEKRKGVQREREEKLFDMARRWGSVQSYQKYLDECVLCEHEEEAHEFIDKVTRDFDKSDWLAAKAQNTVAGYQRYLAQHPQGFYVDAARECVDQFLWEEHSGDQAALEKATSNGEWLTEKYRRKVEDALHKLDLAADAALWKKVSGNLAKLEGVSGQWRTESYLQKAQGHIDELKQKQAEQEEVLWTECINEDTAEGYQRYLDESELRQYESDAVTRLKEKEEERQAREADEALWKKVSGNLAKLEGASDQWRIESYRQKAQAQIDELKQKQTEQEEALWSDCTSDDTEASYKRYLDKSELRRYEAEAKERLAGKVKQREDLKADQAFWKKVSGSLVKLEAASGQWRTDEYRLKAQKKISELEQAARITREETLWSSCCQENTEANYQHYLDESELRRYEAVARNCLSKLEEQADQMLWEKVSGDLAELTNTVGQWRSNDYRLRAHDRISELRQAEEKRLQEQAEREEKLWSDCRKKDTVASYQRYLDNSELRRYEIDANECLAEKVKKRDEAKADQALWQKVSGDLAELVAAADEWYSDDYRLRAQDRISELREAEAKRLQEQAEREESLWSECRKADTEASYQCYLEKSERQNYVIEASNRLAEKVQQREALEADQAFWGKVSGDLVKLKSASGQWRTNEYQLKMHDRITELRDAEAKRLKEQAEREEALWTECRQEDTENDYQRYLAESTLLRYKIEAEECLAGKKTEKEETLWTECRTEDTEKGYQRYLDESELRQYESAAATRLKEKEEARQAREADEALWKKVFENIAKLEGAWGQWRTEAYRQKVQPRIGELKQKQVEQEEALWTACRTEDTAEGYRRYLTESTLRRYQVEAEERLAGKKTEKEEALWAGCRNEDTAESYQRYLDESELRQYESEAATHLKEKKEITRCRWTWWQNGLIVLLDLFMLFAAILMSASESHPDVSLEIGISGGLWLLAVALVSKRSWWFKGTAIIAGWYVFALFIAKTAQDLLQHPFGLAGMAIWAYAFFKMFNSVWPLWRKGLAATVGLYLLVVYFGLLTPRSWLFQMLFIFAGLILFVSEVRSVERSQRAKGLAFIAAVFWVIVMLGNAKYSTLGSAILQFPSRGNEKLASIFAPSPGAISTDPITGMELVYVKGGCYQMGVSSEESLFPSAATPVHEVCVDDFWMGKYEVTQEEWERVMGGNPSEFKKGSRYPVEAVSWDDVQNFLLKLNSQSGRQYRLPTEAEWEYAARSGGKQEKWAGTGDETRLGEYVWSKENSGGSTHEVGTRKPNGLGLYDMSGNVFEWCSDWYGDEYYKNSPKMNPQGPSSGDSRVVRGGAWGTSSSATIVTNHGGDLTFTRNALLGGRLVLPSNQRPR